MQNLNFDSLINLYDSFSDVKFLKKNHRYEIKGELAKLSVSGLISKYKKPFDKENVAKNCARRDGLTVEQVLKNWEYSGKYSCHKGDEFHRYAESYYERKKLSIDRDELVRFLTNNNDVLEENKIIDYYSEMALLIKNFQNFYDWWKQDHILIKSEFVIADKDKKIGGTIDNLSFNKKTNEFVMFDYKTNKEIKREGYKGEKMLAPLNEVPNCELSHYSLQLNLYSIMFEKHTPFKIANSYIVWMAGQDNYELIPSMDYKKEAQVILDNV